MKGIRRTLALAAGAAGVATAVALSTPASAHWAGYHHWAQNDAGSAGVAFFPTGDKFELYDRVADGHWVYFKWKYAGSDLEHPHENHNGAGTHTHVDINLHEHVLIEVNVCTYVNDWPDDCSGWKKWSTSV